MLCVNRPYDILTCRLVGDYTAKHSRSLYNFSKIFVISDIVITNVYNLKSTETSPETKPIKWCAHESHVLDYEQTVMLLHKSISQMKLSRL